MPAHRTLLVLLAGLAAAPVAAPAVADLQIVEDVNAVSAELDGRLLWTYNHDPAEGKPYFHPLSSTDGTNLTDLRPADHPHHRGVWFSWKYINAVNYWEENRKTRRSEGETRVVAIKRVVSDEKRVRLELDVAYAPDDGRADPVLQERRSLVVTEPDDRGVYRIEFSSNFTALEDVLLDRTPTPTEPDGKPHGGYAGWSVRMNEHMRGGRFINSHGSVNAPRERAAWNVFQAPGNGGLIFEVLAENPSYPSTWYVAKQMPYFSPCVLYQSPYSLKAGETLSLSYRLTVCPGTLAAEFAEKHAESRVDGGARD